MNVDITPLVRQEFMQLMDVTTVDQALRWVLRNSWRARKREQHVMLMVVDAAADTLRDGSEFYRLEYHPEASQASVLRGRMVTAAANRDQLTVDALVQVWAQWDRSLRRDVLVELVGTLIGGRLT
ncbi:hypothetical protein [Microbacterium sp. NPDC087589]|uniref:hypothetical protein n=1 Tax=Microbacterium sp. NPDC087589 TaxID=3364191 RepID=UPI0037FD37E7